MADSESAGSRFDSCREHGVGTRRARGGPHNRRTGSIPAASRELGGLTGATFSLIPNIEAGLAARWAWEETAARGTVTCFESRRADVGAHVMAHPPAGPADGDGSLRS